MKAELRMKETKNGYPREAQRTPSQTSGGEEGIRSTRPVYALVGAMVEARHEVGLTQGEIARRMGTTQSVVARLENAHHLPSLDLVTRYAAALGRRIHFDFVPAK
ncbi:MAG: helix-turn-helix transcriptional regulator [Hyphomicrobiales bacterium]|nr:helix-turn-helix transcriptional regulator [Hyphomicrobiales bacterium]